MHLEKDKIETSASYIKVDFHGAIIDVHVNINWLAMNEDGTIVGFDCPTDDYMEIGSDGMQWLYDFHIKPLKLYSYKGDTEGWANSLIEVNRHIVSEINVEIK